MKKYSISNAHYERRCHPETCCCSTDLVVVEHKVDQYRQPYTSIVQGVKTVEEGEALIAKLEGKGKTETIYGYAVGHIRQEDGTPLMIVKECDKRTYEEQFRINWQTAYKYECTPEQAKEIRRSIKEGLKLLKQKNDA